MPTFTVTVEVEDDVSMRDRAVTESIYVGDMSSENVHFAGVIAVEAITKCFHRDDIPWVAEGVMDALVKAGAVPRISQGVRPRPN